MFMCVCVRVCHENYPHVWPWCWVSGRSLGAPCFEPFIDFWAHVRVCMCVLLLGARERERKTQPYCSAWGFVYESNCVNVLLPFPCTDTPLRDALKQSIKNAAAAGRADDAPVFSQITVSGSACSYCLQERQESLLFSWDPLINILNIPRWFFLNSQFSQKLLLPGIYSPG